VNHEQLHSVAWWRQILEPQVEGDSLLGASVHFDSRAPGRTSRIHHVSLQWAQDRGPQRLLVKASHATFSDLHLEPPPQWRVEAGFYLLSRNLGLHCVPRCWYAESSDDGLSGMLILDQLDEVHQWRHPIGEQDLLRAIPALVSVQAATWDGSGVDLSWAPDGDLLFAAQMPQVWQQLRHLVDPGQQAFLDPLIPMIPEAVARSRGSQRCLVHGDLSPRNIITDHRGVVTIIDFGTSTYGLGAIDIARLAAACPSIAEDIAGHRRICETWRVQLVEQVRRTQPDFPGYDADQAWADYCDGLLINAQYVPLLNSPPSEESRLLGRSIVTCLGIEHAAN
jgi:hypothetical protein